MEWDAGPRMDAMYRSQRHVYDLTRKFYLLGRDELLAGLQPKAGARICEIGCGTGRNLVLLARRYEDAEVFGIDASIEMLKTADKRIAREGLGRRIHIRRCLAEELDPEAGFGLTQAFDIVLFSYTLSMIPCWDRAVDRAIRYLEPGGLLAVVDFSEQRGLPAWFRTLLRRWLALFGVEPRTALPGYLKARADRDDGLFSAESLYGDYACLLRYRRPPPVTPLLT